MMVMTSHPSTDSNGSLETSRISHPLDSPSDKTLDELVQLFKLLADDTRLRILSYLQQSDELNVRELCKMLHQRQPSVSHHLALLKNAGLIDMRRDGKHNYYHLVPAKLEEFITMFFGGSPGHPGRVTFEGFELRYAPVVAAD